MSHMRALPLNNIYSLLQSTPSKIPCVYKAFILKSLLVFFHISLEHVCKVGKRRIHVLNDNEININMTVPSECFLG